jgi:hypothetical protein
MSFLKMKSKNKEPEIFSDYLDNTVTMQDDVAQAMIEKKKGKILTSSDKIRIKDNIQRDLAQVYTNDDGEIPDLTKLDKMQRPLWQTIFYSLVVMFTVLFIFAAIGFLVFANLTNQTFTNENVIFKIESPLSIISGQDQEYTIIIANREKVNLYNLEIELMYPEGFTYVSGTLETVGDKKNNWNISVLRPGETVEIKFVANFLAPLSSVGALSGTLNFKPENLNADFRQRAFLDLNVGASVIELSLMGSDKILADKNINYVISLKNLGSDELTDLEVVIEPSKDFTLVSSTPKMESDSTEKIWNINLMPFNQELDNEADDEKEVLKENLETKITVEGNYSLAEDEGNREFIVLVYFKKDGQRILMARNSIISKVIKDQLSVSLIINSSAEDQAVNFDDLLFYTLSYKNTGQEEIKNIEIKAILDSEVLLWEALSDSNNGLREGSSLTWTGKEIPKLLNLRPGEEGTISWQIRVSDRESLSQLVRKFSIESEAQVKGQLLDGSTNEVKSKKILNSINSDLDLDVLVRYYDENNLPLGAGPIMPKVGETSSYNIVFTLTNNIHDIGDIEISASLPRNVSWTNRTDYDLGEINYDGINQRINWKINSLSRNRNKVEANFNLSIVPNEDDFGRVLILLPEIKLKAMDLTTGSDINKTIRAITTSFKDPILGQVSGIVE